MNVALVTGAAGGQGEAIVRRLRADGFSVAACDLRADELKAVVDDIGDENVIGIPLDVASEEQWIAAVNSVIARFGALNALVNNAGALHRAPIQHESVANFEKIWRVNCLGPFIGIQVALPHLKNATNPSIVNTCSTGAIRPFPNHAAYGSSKWALRGLTQTVAAELVTTGIRVNAVFPGPIRTPMLAEDTKARLVASMTWGRLGEPTEIADAVAFLVGPHASFITGAELAVDGGQSLQIG